MKIITSINELQEKMKAEKKAGKTVGFVPTMGSLHEGHLSLLKRAKAENEIVVISVFVNPLQFGPNEDFDAYPRDLQRDSDLAETEGINYLFAPSVQEMYPNVPSVRVTVEQRTDVLCGKSRPGHFDGVATVLTKLFNIVLPDRAYFGLKDAQQVAVIEGLVSDFHFPIQLVAVETVREQDGLAKSSRNVYLSNEERQQAPVLYKSLASAKAAIEAGDRESSSIVTLIENKITSETSGIIDYVEILSYPELKPLGQLTGKVLIALAVRFSGARLIDNIIVNV